MRLIVTCSGLAIALTFAGLPVNGFAHHSVAASFDVNVIIELEGEVGEILWQNPHVLFDLSVTSESGQAEIWTIEGMGLSGLRSQDIFDPFVSTGDRVRVAGNPGRRDDRHLYISNLLRPGGEELTLRGRAEPRFTERAVARSGARYSTEGDSSKPALGIFRIWSTTTASPFPFPEDGNPPLAHTDFPLTDSARAVLEAFDPIDDSPILDCAIKGMPVIMEQPYPMEVTELDGNIVLHMEEYDAVRTIYMDAGSTPEAAPAVMGHSVGRWEGNTLIVDTTHLGWGWYDAVGIPLSEDAHLVEEFTLSDDGSRLDWTMVVTDAATFTEPVELEKFFLYVPGVELRPFDCAVPD